MQDNLQCFRELQCPQTKRRIFKAQPPALFQQQSLAMEGPAPSLSDVTFFVNFKSGATICHGVPHKPSQFVNSQASLSVCLVQLLPRTTPFLVMRKTAPVRSWWPTKIPWVMRLAKELTLSPPLLRNQTFSPNCSIGFLHLPPVLLISLVFPSLPILISFMTCAAKRGSQLSNGLSSDTHTCVMFSGNSESSALSFHFSHSHFNTTIGHVITLKWSLRNHFHSHTCVNHQRLWSAFVLGSLSHFKMILRKPRSLMKPTRNEMEHAVGPFRSQNVAPVWPYLLSRQIRIGNVSAFSCVKKP